MALIYAAMSNVTRTTQPVRRLQFSKKILKAEYIRFPLMNDFLFVTYLAEIQLFKYVRKSPLKLYI